MLGYNLLYLHIAGALYYLYVDYVISNRHLYFFPWSSGCVFSLAPFKIQKDEPIVSLFFAVKPRMGATTMEPPRGLLRIL